MTRLLRAIDEAETDDVLRFGDYRLSPHGGGKYFTFAEQDQEKHIPGSNNFILGKSELTADPDRLRYFAGTGQQVTKVSVGQPGSKERVDFGFTIGTYRDDAGNALPTTKGMIVYSKRGCHIYPVRP